MDIISTKGVAAVLGVSEATVKRWADAGMLRCFRTRGGHRKFRLRDVKAFLADEEVAQPPPKPPAPTTELTPQQREVHDLALAGDVDGLVSFIANEHLRGVSLASMFDNVVAPALRDIGAGWSSGMLSIAQEHVAANAIADMLARVRPLVERRSRQDKGRALCACVGDEHHDIAVRMVALVLVEQGYRPTVLGGTVPSGDLARMMAGERPSLIALSASACSSLESLRGDLGVLASAANTSRTKIVVGGGGFAQLATLPAVVRRIDTLEELAAPDPVTDGPPPPSSGLGSAPASGSIGAPASASS